MDTKKFYGVCGCCNKRQELQGMLTSTDCSICGMPVIPSSKALEAGYPQPPGVKNPNRCKRCDARLRIGNEGIYCAPCEEAIRKAGPLPEPTPSPAGEDESLLDHVHRDGGKRKKSIAFSDIE